MVSTPLRNFWQSSQHLVFWGNKTKDGRPELLYRAPSISASNLWKIGHDCVDEQEVHYSVPMCFPWFLLRISSFLLVDGIIFASLMDQGG